MIGTLKEVTIADIGAGMFSTTGSVWPDTKVNLYPSDKLADEFNRVLKEFKFKPIIPVEKQDMENLTYPDEMFDIVHCVNALDHTENPRKALFEMYRICKKGGWIYLRHHFNTARLQKNMGMHRWNIHMTIDKNCVFWSNSGGFLLSDCFDWWQTEAKKELGYERYNMIVSKYHKK